MSDPTPTDVELEPAHHPARRSRFPHFPALDGLRGLAVVAVVLFDLGSRWTKGGHLGISTLFTLWGFLAAASLLAERGDGHPIDHARFWIRRFRHILVPALIALAAAVVFGVAAASAIQRHNLAADGLTAMASVANWRFIASHAPFGPPTTLSSPVRQFWALAVIAQVVLVVSVLTVWLLERRGWSRQRLAVLLGAGAVASTALCLILHHDAARVLYGTDTRAAEVLVGCLLAVVIYDPRVTIRLAVPGPVRDSVNFAGVVAAIALAICWMTLAPTNTLLVSGGLLVVALLSGTVVLASIVPDGPLPWLLGSPPLRQLGRVAIALYLIHWPVFVWVDHAHTGLSGNALVLGRLVVAAGAAVAVQAVYELGRDRLARLADPNWSDDADRSGDADQSEAGSPDARGSGGRRQLTLAAGVAVVTAIALVAVTVTGPAVGSTVQAAGTTSTSTTTLAPLPAPTVAFYGDALASTLEASAKSYAAQTGKIKVVEGVASPTCGIDRDEQIADATGAAVPLPAECSTWDTQWASAAATAKPDIAVVVTGISELADHKEPTDPAFAGPGDTSYDYQLLLLMHKAVEALTASGTKVLWLNLPTFQPGSGAPSDQARVTAFNTLLTSLGQELPGQVTIAGLGTWVAANGGPGAEPSQNGWAAAAADHVVQDYLAGQIAGLWRAAHSSAPTTTTTAAAPATAPSVSLAPPPIGVDTGADDTTRTTGSPDSTSTTAAEAPKGHKKLRG